MKNPYIIGLDLGINNIGYSIIDQKEEKIIKKGVRLFNPSNDANDRRQLRNARRIKKRKANRINEALKLFEAINFPNKKTIDEKLLEKRLTALKSKVEKQDIVNITCYFMAHRGYIPYGDEEYSLVKLENEYPCEYYQRIYNEKGKYRALNELVLHKDIVKEFKAILETQIKYYPELNKIIGNEETGLLWILSRKRKFWEGPGSINSFTKYGRFKNEEDAKEYQNLIANNKEKYLFEDLIGKCEIYINEKCTYRSNYYAEIFNLLNDFINITITNIDNIKSVDYVEQIKDKNMYKLTTKALEEILSFCLSYEGSLSYTQVLKNVLGITKNDISGFRIDRQGKPEFSLLKYVRMVIKEYKDNNIDSTWLTENNYKNYNELIKILAVAPGITETEKLLSSIHTCSEEEKEIIKNIQRKLKGNKGLQTHSLSEKALIEVNKKMISTCLNYNQVYKKYNYDKEAKEYFLKNYGTGEGKLLITTKFIDEIIASPQVKKTLRQSIRIINAIIKEQNQLPEIICIESTKEVNSDERRKEIEKEQKEYEKNRENARKELENIYGETAITDNLIEKCIYFNEMRGRCAYCDKQFSINDLGSLEVEHILPISQSADNSQNNKTIACKNCNDNKRNRTPYDFLQSNFDKFEDKINKLSISDQKKRNFLFKEDLNKYTIRFINRNLRDTSYATKELVNQIKLYNEYIKAYSNETPIKTLSTPGQITSKIREKWGLEKNRDEGKFHHAVDASIIASIPLTGTGKTMIKIQNNDRYLILNKDRIKFTVDDFNEMLNIKTKSEIEKITSDDDILISTQVNKDANRQISNANIYSYIKKDDEYYIIDKVKDIYAKDLIKNNKDLLRILFNENDKTKTLLCEEQNPKLYKLLKDIYTKYQHDNNNPFLNYCKEKNDVDKGFDYTKHGIKAPSKKGNGPIIKDLRYMKKTTEPYLLNKNNINKKENTLIGLDSIGIYCIDLYWDKDLKRFYFIPIYMPAVNTKTKFIDRNNPIYQKYYNKIKDKNIEHIVELYNGNSVEIIKKDGVKINSSISSFNKTNQIITLKNEKYFAAKDKLILYDTDILGNKKKRLTWPED